MSRIPLAADMVAQAHRRLLVLLREQGQENEPPPEVLEHAARRAVQAVLWGGDLPNCP
jgi:hypothetical protein